MFNYDYDNIFLLSMSLFVSYLNLWLALSFDIWMIQGAWDIFILNLTM